MVYDQIDFYLKDSDAFCKALCLAEEAVLPVYHFIAKNLVNGHRNTDLISKI